MLDTIPAPIFHTDKEYVCTGCNTSLAKFLGKSANEIREKTVHEIALPHLADVYHVKDVELMESSGVQLYESQVKRKNRPELNVIFHKATSLDQQGHVNGMLGVIFNITELRQAERTRENFNTELQEALINSYCPG